jgi:hypothetical protein
MDASSLIPGARLALAVVWMIAPALPVWAMVLWAARSSAGFRTLAARLWVRYLAVGYALAAFMFSSWATRVVLIPESLDAQRTVLVVGIAQIALLALAVAWLKKRRGGGRWAPVPAVSPSATTPAQPRHEERDRPGRG